MRKLRGVVVSRAPLRPDQLAVPAYTAAAGQQEEPVEPDWLCIVHWTDLYIPPKHETYELAFYTDDGERLEGRRCDTLEIALGQADELVGVKPGDWEPVHLPVPGRPGESRLSDWTPTDAFPSALRPSADDPRFAQCLPVTDLKSAGQFTVNVDGQHLHIPDRIYNPPPADELLSGLTLLQRRMVDCLYTRHHDGFVRQRALERIVDASEAWVVPYVVRLLGEYVIEIIEAIADRVPDTPEVRASYGEFCRDNPDFIRRTAARATSYWNCYHRRRFPDPSDYPGHIALRRLCGPTGPSPPK